MQNLSNLEAAKKYLKLGMVIAVAILGSIVFLKEVGRQNPEVQAFFNRSFLAGILGEDALPLDYWKASYVNDNYHRCQNKLGFTAKQTLDSIFQDIYINQGQTLIIGQRSPSAAKIAELEAPLIQMYKAGGRFAYIEVELNNPAEAGRMAQLAGEYAKLASRNNLMPVFNLGPRAGTGFLGAGEQQLIANFIRATALKAGQEVEFVVNAYPAASFNQGPADYAAIKKASDAIARSLQDVKNAIVTPPPMQMTFNPGCPGAGGVCVPFGPVDDSLSLFSQMNLFRGDPNAEFNFDYYDMLMFGFENYDATFKNFSEGGLSKESRMAYTHFRNAYGWLQPYNDRADRQKELQVLVINYAPGDNTVTDSNRSVLSERLSFDFGLLSDDPSIYGVVVGSKMYAYEDSFESETFRQMNLAGTNCNYDLIDYQTAYSAQSIAPVCQTVTNVNGVDTSDPARTRVVCDVTTGMCEAVLQYTVQVGLPIKFFGSNSATGTDTQTTIPPSAKAAKQSLPYDFLNQFAGALTSSQGTYTIPWLGNAINSSRIGLGSMLTSLPEYLYPRRPSDGSYIRFAALEQVAESTENPIFNNWTFNTRGTGKFNLRDEVSICFGKDACINKELVTQLDGLKDYNSDKQTFATKLEAPMCSGNLQYLNRDPQNYIYGSEQVIKEVVERMSIKQLGYKLLTGQLRASSVPGSRSVIAGVIPGQRCTTTSGSTIIVTTRNIGNCIENEALYDIITVSNVPTVYTESNIYVEDTLPQVPRYEIPGAYDALAANYNLLQQTLAFQGKKMIFGQNIGWEADIQVRAYSAVTRPTNVEGQTTFGITSPRKNNMLETFNHDAVVPPEKYLGDKIFSAIKTPGGGTNSNPNSCRVGINLAVLSGAVNSGLIDSIESTGYQQALIITTGAESDKQTTTNALNSLCERGITPVLRSCYTGVCEFSDGVQQGAFLNEVINNANKCQSVYAICGHNEPESENPKGFVNEGQWTKQCFDAVSTNSKIKVTTPTFNATHPELETQINQFHQGYGLEARTGEQSFSIDKPKYACLSLNSYTFLDGRSAVESAERMVNDPRFSGMPLCIFETGVTGEIDQAAQNANVGNVVKQLFDKYGDRLVMALGFNWNGANPDPVWNKFILTEENNKNLATCQFGGGGANYTIPGKYIARYENYMAEGTNWRTDKQYYEWLGSIDEINRLIDVYANNPVIDTTSFGVLNSDIKECPVDAKTILSSGGQINCLTASISDPRMPGYLEDPLGQFLCSKGYNVIGTDCGRVCKPQSKTIANPSKPTTDFPSTSQISGFCPIKADQCWQGPAGDATHYCRSSNNEPAFDFFPSALNTSGDNRIYAPESGTVVFADGWETPACTGLTKENLVNLNQNRTYGDKEKIINFINSVPDVSIFQSSGGYIGFLGDSGVYYRLRHIDINARESQLLNAQQVRFNGGEALTVDGREIKLYYTPGPSTPAGANGAAISIDAVYTPCWMGAHLHAWAKVNVEDPQGTGGQMVDPYILFGDVLGCSSARTCTNDYKCQLPEFVAPPGITQVFCQVNVTPISNGNFSSIEDLASAVARSVAKSMNTHYPAGMLMATLVTENGSLKDDTGRPFNGDPLQQDNVEENPLRVSGPMQFMDTTFKGIITTNETIMRKCLEDLGIQDLPYELSMRNYMGPAMCAAAIKHISNARGVLGTSYSNVIQQPSDWYNQVFDPKSGQAPQFSDWDIIDYRMSAIHVAARRYYGACRYSYNNGAVTGDYCQKVYGYALEFRGLN